MSLTQQEQAIGYLSNHLDLSWEEAKTYYNGLSAEQETTIRDFMRQEADLADMTIHHFDALNANRSDAQAPDGFIDSPEAILLARKMDWSRQEAANFLFNTEGQSVTIGDTEMTLTNFISRHIIGFRQQQSQELTTFVESTLQNSPEQSDSRLEQELEEDNRTKIQKITSIDPRFDGRIKSFAKASLPAVATGTAIGLIAEYIEPLTGVSIPFLPIPPLEDIALGLGIATTFYKLASTPLAHLLRDEEGNTDTLQHKIASTILKTATVYSGLASMTELSAAAINSVTVAVAGYIGFNRFAADRPVLNKTGKLASLFLAAALYTTQMGGIGNTWDAINDTEKNITQSTHEYLNENVSGIKKPDNCDRYEKQATQGLIQKHRDQAVSYLNKHCRP